MELADVKILIKLILQNCSNTNSLWQHTSCIYNLQCIGKIYRLECHARSLLLETRAYRYKTLVKSRVLILGTYSACPILFVFFMACILCFRDYSVTLALHRMRGKSQEAEAINMFHGSYICTFMCGSIVDRLSRG